MQNPTLHILCFLHIQLSMCIHAHKLSLASLMSFLQKNVDSQFKLLAYPSTIFVACANNVPINIRVSLWTLSVCLSEHQESRN
jgi:hypothetical protein